MIRPVLRWWIRFSSRFPDKKPLLRGRLANSFIMSVPHPEPVALAHYAYYQYAVNVRLGSPRRHHQREGRKAGGLADPGFHLIAKPLSSAAMLAKLRELLD
jgi:hypothetical protein